ncbi:TetR/AcrR family transcriptional regulator [Rudaeicoccus suwonensis]|uniref:TetR family transcriptional regulator n=1 Tax=Rudaeicoccus suwonensis TaxID=657409 RepID=A0A561E404_9MICO|nr:TetR/AcrR family transcriptional regulator [Rudaeicoccus suwonensis]TWE10347.1 TetR family transcriptional regulator [Rudaeicoccus suwonensis]
MSLKESASGRRRRGNELQEALLDAAWAELTERGYDDFTIEAVADRASTSRAVIYRRWSAKPDLVRAALVHYVSRETLGSVDTGSLRGDLLAMLRRANELRAPVVTLIVTQLGAFYREADATLADVRHEMTGSDVVLNEIFERAVARGEADPAKLTPRVRAVTFDLYRNEVLMTQQPQPEEVLVSIVDEVALPLVR